MAELKIEGLDETLSFIDGLPPTLLKEVRRLFVNSAARIQSRMVKRSSNKPLNARTGELARSWKFSRTTRKIDDANVSIYSTSPYSLIHEVGGVIKAKNAYRKLPGGPYLNIPTSENKTPVGVTRLSARDVFNQGAHIRRLKSSNKAKYGVFLGDKPMFWLVKEVNIPARLGFVETATGDIPTLLSQLAKMNLT